LGAREERRRRDHQVVDFQHVEHPPSRTTRQFSRAAELIREEPKRAVLHTVDVRLDDAKRAVVGELDQAVAGDREFQIVVDGMQGYQAILGGDINRREARLAPDESFLHDAADPPSVSVWRNIGIPTKMEHESPRCAKDGTN
jgi:hypothetical protein